MERLQQIATHLTPSRGGVAALQRKSADDIVVTLAVRSPMCKAWKGQLKDTRADELLTSLYKAVIMECNFDPALVQDITVGNVLAPGQGYVARASALAAGFPESTTTQVINRFCSSGLMAVNTVANQIRAGQIDIGLAIGVESMSAQKDEGAPQFSDDLMAHQAAADCRQPMGWTSENVAADFNISREDMDKFAALSHTRAAAAQAAGHFEREIVPIESFQKDASTGERRRVVISRDDGIRGDSTPEKLGKIRAAFPQWGAGRTTGGNASQITDGGAAVMLMTRRRAEQLGLKILAKYITTATVGLAPRIMGIGPSLAIPKVLEQAGLKKDDVDLFEINEAFASMYVYCVRHLGLDIDKVNVNGGAIALGHPLGCTGARQVATGLNELERRNGKVLVTSMCIGLGMGAAAVFVRD